MSPITARKVVAAMPCEALAKLVTATTLATASITWRYTRKSIWSGTLSLVMHVWCGTPMNSSRKSTHTGRSMNGISSTGPGPRSPMHLPSLNTTTRLYSRTTRIDWLSVPAISATRRMSTTMLAMSSAFMAWLLFVPVDRAHRPAPRPARGLYARGREPVGPLRVDHSAGAPTPPGPRRRPGRSAPPGHARHQRPRVEQLDEYREEADGHQQIGDVRIEGFLGDQLHGVRVDGSYLCTCHMDSRRAGASHHAATLQIAEQCVHVRRKEIRDMLRNRLLGIQRDTLSDGILDPAVVSTPLAGDTGQVRRGIAGDLPAQIPWDVPATSLDRVRRADIRARRHGQDIGGFGDEHPSRCGARTGRRHVRHRRYRAIQEVLHHLAHGRVQTARRIDHQHQQHGALVVRGADDTVNVLRGGRAHDVGEVSHNDSWSALGLGRDGACRCERCEREQRSDEGRECEASAHEIVPRF